MGTAWDWGSTKLVCTGNVSGWVASRSRSNGEKAMVQLTRVVRWRAILGGSYCRQQGVLEAVTIMVSRYAGMFYVGEIWWPEELYSLGYYYFSKKCFIVVHTVGTSE